MAKEQSVELRWIVAVVRHWLWLIAGCTLLGAVIAFAVSSLIPPTYRASATLLVSPAPAPGESEYSALLSSERLALTYAEMLPGRPVLEEVIARLELHETPGTLAEEIGVSLVEDTQLIRVMVTSSAPTRAAVIANTVAEVFIEQIQALQADRYADSLGSAEEQIADLSALIAETQSKIDLLATPGTPQEEEELARLETILAGYRSTHASLQQTYQQMRLTATRSTHNVTVFEEAQAPESPLQRRTLYTIIAAIAGAMLGLGLAFLLEHLDDTIKTPEDVSQTLGLGTLGEIGKLAKGEQELAAIAQPVSPFAEAFRVLGTGIRHASKGRPLRNLLVTSPGPLEGKSITVANLAAVMAQSGLKVVAVDADLRQPRLSRLFDLDGRGQDAEEGTDWGLTGALREGYSEDKLRPTAVDGLMVLPTGELPTNPAKPIGSQHMHDLLQVLTQQADMVLVDSPPALPVADASALVPSVDAVLLVLKAGHTRREAARRAVEHLRQVGGNPIGVVLNGVNADRYEYYRYYRDRSGEQMSLSRRWKERLIAIGRRFAGRRTARGD